MKNELAKFNEEKFYCSINVESNEEKATLYNALSNPDYKLKDFINKVIKVKNIVAESTEVEKVDEDGTITITEVPRIILIDDKNKSYSCMSKGVFNSIQRMLSIYGSPAEWDKPLNILVSSKTIGSNGESVLLLKVEN